MAASFTAWPVTAADNQYSLDTSYETHENQCFVSPSELGETFNGRHHLRNSIQILCTL